MKKIAMIFMAFTMMVGLTGCAITSGVGTNIIKESKLTNISYVKKICDVKPIHSEKGDTIYLLDDGKGYLVHIVTILEHLI